MLQQGSKGSAVQALQVELNKTLPAGQKIGVDGDFGPGTKTAVENFQRSHGLTADGVVGPQTQAALDKATSGSSTTPAPAPKPDPTPTPAPSGGSGTTNGPEQVSVTNLRKVMTNLPLTKANAYISYLNQAMNEFAINTHLRRAAFLGQIAEESVELVYFHEIASGWEYDISKNRAKALELGNTAVGDGPKYKGRGPIQLTGKSNYAKCGTALKLNLVDNPDIVAQPNVAFRASGWFWSVHGLNALADASNFREITHRINGGYTNESVREMYYNRALKVV